MFFVGFSVPHTVMVPMRCGISEFVYNSLEFFDDVCDCSIVLEFVLDEDAE